MGDDELFKWLSGHSLLAEAAVSAKALEQEQDGHT